MLSKKIIQILKFYKNITKEATSDYDILKSISDQIKLLSWAIGGVFGYFSSKVGLGYTVFIVSYLWLTLQSIAIIIMVLAKEYKDKRNN